MVDASFEAVVTEDYLLRPTHSYSPKMFEPMRPEQIPALAFFSWYTIYETVSGCQETFRRTIWRPAGIELAEARVAGIRGGTRTCENVRHVSPSAQSFNARAMSKIRTRERTHGKLENYSLGKTRMQYNILRGAVLFNATILSS